MLEAVDQLMAALKERGSEKAVDMDDAAQRVSMEVTVQHLHVMTVPFARCSVCTCADGTG